MMIKTCLFVLLFTVLTANLYAQDSAVDLGVKSNIDSCFILARGYSSPGISSVCASAEMSQESARATIENNPLIKNVGGKWYVFVPYQIKTKYATLWYSMSNIVSAMESLGHNFDEIYFVKTPENAREVAAIQADSLIESLYLGQVKRISQKAVESIMQESVVFPSMHHHSIFQFVVWDQGQSLM